MESENPHIPRPILTSFYMAIWNQWTTTEPPLGVFQFMGEKKGNQL